MRLSISIVAIAALLASACAEENPGIAPDSNRLHFPTGLAVADAQDRLIIASSNFDQRYNAGSLIALSLDELFAFVDGATTSAPLGSLPAVKSFVRIHSFASDLRYVDTAAGPRVYVASRGRNRLTMAKLEGGKLNCTNAGVEPLLGFDCTAAHVIHTGGDDPFTIQYIEGASSMGLLAIGHLRPVAVRVGDGQFQAATIGLVDIFGLEDRVRQEAAKEPLRGPAVAVRVTGLAGVAGVGLTPAYSTSGAPSIIAVSRDNSVDGLNVDFLDLTKTTNVFGLSTRARVSLASGARATATRGLVVDDVKKRAYVSVRFADIGDSSNAGIAIVALDLPTPRIVSVIEVGEELGAPVFLPPATGQASRYLYVPDIRSDSVWVIDVATDAPRVVTQIRGRDRGVIDGKAITLRLIDAPASIAFATRNGKRYGFISNFGNSTLAVLDATSADPRAHKVLTRIGAVLEPDGTGEEDNE